jgi:hypothetical protein
MKTILKINKPKNSIHHVWEHLLGSVFAYVSTYLFLIYAILHLIADRHGSERAEKANWILQVYENPIYLISSCLFVVIGYNCFLIIRNTRKNYIVSIEVGEEFIRFGLTDLYFRKTESIELPIKTIGYDIRTKQSDNDGKKSTLIFINNQDIKVVGIMKSNYIIWNDQLLDIRHALIELANLGVVKNKHKTSYRYFLGFVFNKS